jgi:hypothetical protein
VTWSSPGETTKLLGEHCPCGSGATPAECCDPSLEVIGVSATQVETYFFDWMNRYGPATAKGFNEKARRFGYRLSRYLDTVLDFYMPLDFPSLVAVSGDTNEIYWHQKHNVALTLAGAYTLLAQGMFVQSGILLRTAVESSLVLLDVAHRPQAIDLLRTNKYKSQSVLRQVKELVPKNVVDWYGYLSANFTHVAALHQAPYLPRACYVDNWVIVTGLQNILRGIVAFHSLLERAHLHSVKDPWFWRATPEGVAFIDDSRIFKWAGDLGAEINKALPIDEIPSGYAVSERSVTLKT